MTGFLCSFRITIPPGDRAERPLIYLGGGPAGACSFECCDNRGAVSLHTSEVRSSRLRAPVSIGSLEMCALALRPA